MSSEGQRDASQKTDHRVWNGSAGGGQVGGGVEGVGGWGCRAMDEARPPDGGRLVLNQTETNGVRETERKKFRHEPADLNPFSPRPINTGKCSCGFVLLCACARASVRVPVWRERFLSVSPSIKIRKHSGITSAPLASQPLHMPLFNFAACNPIKA